MAARSRAARLALSPVAHQRRLQAHLIGDRPLDALRRAVGRRQQGPLTLGLQVGALDVGGRRRDRALGLGDLGVLLELVRLEVRDRGLGAGDVGLALGQARPIVVVLDLDQEIACLDLLEVTDRDGADIAVDLGAERRDVAPDIRIVGRLGAPHPDPAVPAGGQQQRQPADDQHDRERPREPGEPGEQRPRRLGDRQYRGVTRAGGFHGVEPPLTPARGARGRCADG